MHGSTSSPLSLDSLEGAVQNVGGMLTTIGVAVVMVGMLILGIRYMMASPEEAAKIKGQLVGLSVSAVVIFGAWGIWNFVDNILSGTLGTGGISSGGAGVYSQEEVDAMEGKTQGIPQGK